MQKKIHPKNQKIVFTCSCGNKIEAYSTLNADMHIEVCAQCHPFFTGKQKIIDSGQVERFRKRFGRTKIFNV